MFIKLQEFFPEIMFMDGANWAKQSEYFNENYYRFSSTR